MTPLTPSRTIAYDDDPFVTIKNLHFNGNIKNVCVAILLLLGLWALINAANYCVCGELEWQTQNHCDQQFRVNYVGVVEAIRIFLPLLKSGKGVYTIWANSSRQINHILLV